MDGNNVTNETSKAKTPKNTAIVFFVILSILILVSSILLYYLISTRNTLHKKSVELELLSEEKSNLETNLQSEKKESEKLLAQTRYCARWPNSSIKKFIIPYFKYLDIRLEDRFKDIGNLYTSYWFWCGGSHGTRYLPEEYEEHLEQIGTIGIGFDKEVYVLSGTTPIPTDQHLIPSEKDNSDTQIVIAESKLPEEERNKWRNFLDNQERENYPVVIMKDDEGRYLMYFRVDYVFLPGC